MSQKKYKAYLANLDVEVPVCSVNEDEGKMTIRVSDIPKEKARAAAIHTQEYVTYWYGENAGGNRLIEVEAIDVGLSFSQALALVKKYNRVYRTGWSRKGMYLEIIRSLYVHGRVTAILPYISLVIPGNIGNLNSSEKAQVVPWSPSQTDLLSEDWILVETQ